MSTTADEEPWLNVQTLAAYAYCPNAGRIAFLRQGFENKPDSFRIPNLSYVPQFDDRRLRERSAELQRKLAVWVILILAEIGFVLYLANLGHVLYALALALFVAPSVYYAYIDAEHFWKTLKQLREYEATLPQQLPEYPTGPIAIHWWAIVKSGFAPVLPREYRDQACRLIGQPWRLLIHQGTGEKIPVLQYHESFDNQLTVTTAERSSLHLAACAKLIETHENGTIRWGLIVDSKSLHAFAVPLADTNRDEVIEKSAQALHWLTAQQRLLPIEPPAGACISCPLSYPRLTGRPTQLGKDYVAPYYYFLPDTLDWQAERTSSRDPFTESDEEYCHYEYDDDVDSNLSFVDWLRNSSRRPPPRHSDCGDIFQWAPTHAYWEQKRAKAADAYQNWLDRQGY